MGANPSNGGTDTPASGTYYTPGTIVPISATPAANFVFTGWASNPDIADTTMSSTNVTMNEPETVTANFTNNVNVTVNTSPGGLQVSVDGGTSQSAPVSLTWQIGSTHTIATTSPQTATGTQYTFASWSDSGALSHSVVAPASTTSYTATFNTAYQLTTGANPVADGSVTPTLGTFYPAGTVVNLTATANTGYAFSSWTGSVASASSASTTVTMSAPETVTANFITNNVKVTLNTSPGGLQVSVDGGPSQAAPVSLTWQIGSTHTIATTSPQTATGTQYTFASWSDGGALSHSVVAPASTTSYTATFNTAYQLTTGANPVADGSVAPTSGTFYPAGTVVNLTATANTGYAFSSWSGSVASASSASTTVTMSAPETVTANFTATITAEPMVSLSPTSVNFGDVYFVTLKSQKVTLKNIGSATLQISNISLTLGPGSDTYDFNTLANCGSSLTVGQSCTITVIFLADDHAGLHSATLNIADNAPGSPQKVGLSATVINPEASFKPTSLNFGTIEVGKNLTQTVTLTNTGTTGLTITSISVTGEDAGDFVQSNACGSPLAPSAHCTISVTFKPSTTGSRSANLTVIDDAYSGKQNVPLSGKGSH